MDCGEYLNTEEKMKTKRNMKKIKEMDKNRRRRRTKIASEGRLYYRFAEFFYSKPYFFRVKLDFFKYVKTF